jgi:thymidylate kinase
MAKQQGLLITFSGLDGAGKSTQIALLMKRLHRDGREPRYVWTRGGYTPLLERLKGLLRRLPGRIVPPSGHNPQRTQAFRRGWVRRLWLALALLDLVWLYGVRVRWWRWRGRNVICDRYLWDTQMDFRLNLPQENVENKWLWRLLARVTPKPDAAFLLLVPVEESVRRSDVKGEPFRDTPEVLAQRLTLYEAWARQDERRWHVLDGRRPVDELASGVWETIEGSAQVPSSVNHETQPAIITS